jgi:hypothetical protein
MHQFTRITDDGYESKDARLCSMCLDDLWEFVFDSTVDRSDKADPYPVGRLSESVERHIEDLQEVLDELESQ